MRILRQSTATTELIGPLLSSTDGNTQMTAVTLAQADILVWKEGGTTVTAKSDATSATHRAIGYFTCPFDATDTGTLGQLSIVTHKATCGPTRDNFFVVPAAVYDAWKAGTGNGVRADLSNCQASAITSSAFASDALTAAKVAADVGTEIAAAVLAAVVETNNSVSLSKAVRIILGGTMGVTTTGGTVYKDPSGTTMLATITYDGSNNRTAVNFAV